MRTAQHGSPQPKIPVLSPRVRRLAYLFAPLLAVLFAFALLWPKAAFAAGTVTLASTSPQESDGRWKLVMTMNYGATPHIAHIPMNFIFTPKVLYERSLTDQSGEKPVITRIPLQNHQPIVKSMDVGFADATGKVFNVTKFDFIIRRDHGFEAGEYSLEIKRADDGVRMGNAITVKLQGDNPIVDRRAIVFTGEKKKKPAEKKPDESEAKSGGGETSGGDGAGSGEASAGGGDAPPDTSDATPTEAPPPVEPKQGGCGCRLAGEPGGEAGAAAGLAMVGFLFLRRRRRAG